MYRCIGQRRGYRLSTRQDSRRNATSGLSRGDVCIDVRQIYRLPREPSRSFERCHYTRHVFRIGSLDVVGSHPVIYQGVVVIGSLANKASKPTVSIDPIESAGDILRLIIKKKQERSISLDHVAKGTFYGIQFS